MCASAELLRFRGWRGSREALLADVPLQPPHQPLHVPPLCHCICHPGWHYLLATGAQVKPVYHLQWAAGRKELGNAKAMHGVGGGRGLRKGGDPRYGRGFQERVGPVGCEPHDGRLDEAALEVKRSAGGEAQS